jgi:hypothetical protein
MTKILSASAIFTLTLSLILLNSSAQAQTSQNGPYYATPSWDQTLPATTRFVVLSNFNSEAVLDRETGLVWERSPSTSQLDWSSSFGVCLTASTGNRLGWRLPSADEIASLMDPATLSPPAGHPFLGLNQNTAFWTTTTLPSQPSSALTFTLGSGSGLAAKLVTQEHRWCVRGGSAGVALPSN